MIKINKERMHSKMRRDNGYKRGRNAAKKEKIIMIASSAFVLMALTMTGVSPERAHLTSFYGAGLYNASSANAL